MDPNPRGDIWVYDSDTKTPHHVEMEAYPTHADFHPLGISVVSSTTNLRLSTIFVVNHARNATVVEQFKLTTSPPYRATYLRTLSHPDFTSPNAVAAISETTFYVTNDHRFTRRLPNPIGHVVPLVESLLAIPLSWVDRVDLSESGDIQVTRMVSNIAFANGISVSHDGKQVAVASTTAQNLLIFDLDENSDGQPEFVLRNTVEIPFLPDNIEFESDGSITVGGHPHFPSLAHVAAKKKENAPSWIVSVQPRSPPGCECTTPSISPHQSWHNS